jgi:predicted ester cyclase
MRVAFPDLRYEILDVVHDVDRAAVRVRMRGTHEGDLFGIAPTGRTVDCETIQIERFADGRIIEHWRRTDDVTFRQQLGLL